MTSAWRAPIPVICVGNLTVGGAGKTPTALALGRRLAGWGLDLAFLTRGYGGRATGPLKVDPTRHDAGLVGDEPLLLAEVAPTWIARVRRRGAEAAIVEGADVIIMDDGLQNASLVKDLSFVIVDGPAGFGNGRVLPAGPLRESIDDGLARASAVILIGTDDHGLAPRLGRGRPLLTARLIPDATARTLAGRKVFAFAGIARPQKFYATLAALGADVVGTRDFADHHRYSEDDAMQLVEAANRASGAPVTTTKDAVRLPEAARAMVTVVGVELVFDDEAALDRLLMPTLEEAARRGTHG